MSKLYAAPQRAFQDMFDTRLIADAAEQLIVHPEVSDDEKVFIESRDMFFLSTIDARGFPTCSYKGGDPGFVKVVDQRTIAFPSYDGNGMFFSMGNIRGNARIGILFIDFETPHRVRLHGTASIEDNDPLMMEFKDADMVVRVRIEELFINCPRYVHRFTKVKPSQYVPRADCETPFAVWKRIDAIQPALAAKDQGKAAGAGGLITMDEYFARVGRGEG